MAGGGCFGHISSTAVFWPQALIGEMLSVWMGTLQTPWLVASGKTGQSHKTDGRERSRKRTCEINRHAKLGLPWFNGRRKAGLCERCERPRWRPSTDVDLGDDDSGYGLTRQATEVP